MNSTLGSSPIIPSNDSPLQTNPGHWLTKKNLKKIVSWTFLFLVIIWLLAPWLDRPTVQANNIIITYNNEWVLKGQGLASYPMWGYSWLMRILGSINMVIVLQSVVGALATASLLVRLRSVAGLSSKPLLVLFVLAMPWFSFMAYPYQMPFSSAFMILAFLVFELGVITGKNSILIVSVCLFAVGQNFRSELILLPWFLLILFYLLQKFKFINLPSLIVKKLLLVCIGTAVLQLPWAFHCLKNSGRFSLSESNLGHVVYVGLGNSPSNPWKIRPLDSFCQETVSNAGLNCSSLSFQGSDFLLRRSIASIKEHPLGYIKELSRRTIRTIVYPFTFIRCLTTPNEAMALNNIFGSVKRWIPLLTREEPNSSLIYGEVSRIKIIFITSYIIVQLSLNFGVAFFGLVGIYLAIRGGAFRNFDLIMIMLLGVIVYRLCLNIVLCDNGNYMTGVYLCYLPFAANALGFLIEKGSSLIGRR